VKTGLRTEEFSLINLGRMIDKGTMVLADFQRDFDWTEADIRSFLATLLMGWPAGSLLLVEGEPEHVEIRSFVEGPEISKPIRYTVLDGQQRLTSLYFALHDKGPTVYAAQVSQLGSGEIDALEQGLRSFPRETWDEKYRDKPWQGVDEWVPLYALRSAEDYFAWRDRVIAAADESIRRELTLSLASLYADHLSTIHEYPLATVLVGSDLEEGVVARIFERLNREGETLGSFDLVVARVYEPQWNLRTHWDDARLEAGLLERFIGENGLPVLQAIALRRDKNVRQEAVLKIPKEAIHDRWEAAVDGMESAIRFLVEECGVIRREWLPYPNQLVILAALAVDVGLDRHKDALRTWFFSRAFSLRFDAAANTRAVSEYEALSEALSSDLTLSVEPVNKDILLGATRRKQGALWKVFICLLAAHRARDPLGGELDLDPWNEAVVPVSVAPKPEDDDTPEAERPHLRVLTHVLATRETAGKIRRLGIDQVLSEGELDGFPESQFFPPLPHTSGLGINWQRFMQLRLERLEPYLVDQFQQTVEKREIVATFSE
jgi:Protein of unknown function DUF262